MRKRATLAGLVVVAGVLVMPGIAHAAGSVAPAQEQAAKEPLDAAEKEAKHLREECIEILEKGGEVEDCQKAPSPILPEKSEIIWGGLAFAVLFFAMVKWGLPPIRKMVKAREDRIRGDLERAEGAKSHAEGVLAQYQAQLADARAEANRIIEESRQAADQVRRELVARAEADSAELRARAQDDIRLATDRAMSDLRHRVADLSIELAEKVVERSLDRDTQLALIESYINSVGNGSKSG